MQVTETEIESLLDQLEVIRKEKHDVEEARAEAAKQRDRHIEELLSENRELKEKLRTKDDKLEKQAHELDEERKEMSKLEAALFRSKSEVAFVFPVW